MLPWDSDFKFFFTKNEFHSPQRVSAIEKLLHILELDGEG